MRDDSLKVELVTEGLSLPTSMRLIDENNILVLRQHGQVRLVSGGVLVLHLPGELGPFHNGGKIDIGPDGNLSVLSYLDGRIFVPGWRDIPHNRRLITFLTL